MNNKKTNPAIYIVIFLLMFLLMPLLINATGISASGNSLAGFLASYQKFGLLCAALAIGVCVIIFFATRPKLYVKSEKAGDGQHGDADYLNKEEAQKLYPIASFGHEKEAGFLVGVNGSLWQYDASEDNLLLLAPPGAGKTTGQYIPTVKYNAMVNFNTGGGGSSMLLVDIKGALYAATASELEARGYKVVVLNLREVFKSNRYNILNNVNIAMDKYKAQSDKKEKAIAYGAAERYAKIIAGSIIDSAGSTVSSEGSEFFKNTAKGLVTAVILMISEYSTEEARHILSVHSIINELAAPETTDGNNPNVRLLLTRLIDMLTNKRIKNYSGAALSADIRTVLNITSSALYELLRFIDAEFEQIICSHDEAFSAENFLEQPTAVFVICPDENPTRHFMASLFIRSLTDNLIEVIETKYNGKSPRKFLYLLDEFGNLPAIPHVESLFSAIRSRGGRVMIALQSLAQLLNSYSRDKARIIQDTCQMVMFSFVAPTANETASTLSKMLGNETILSGSSSVSDGKSTSSLQLIGRPLLSIDKLVRLPRWTFITMKGGYKPYFGKLKGYWEYLELDDTEIEETTIDYKEIVYADPKMIEFLSSGLAYEFKEGMFE